MTLWLDNQLPPALAPWIRATLLVDCIPIRELNLHRASDSEIFMAARAAQAVVMTKDADFVGLVEQYDLERRPTLYFDRLREVGKCSVRLALRSVVVLVALGSPVAAQTQVPGPTPAISPDALRYLETAFGLVQKNSVRRHAVDWEAVRSKVFAQAAGAQTAAETHGAIRVLLTALGDRHSGFFDLKTVANLTALSAAVSPPPEGRLRRQPRLPDDPAVRERRSARYQRACRPDPGDSGEGVAVAFRGRQQTRFFGQRTRGLSTSNRMFFLSDKAAINLTTHVFADRTGRRYPDGIAPDVVVEDTSPTSIPEAARTWLLSQSECKP